MSNHLLPESRKTKNFTKKHQKIINIFQKAGKDKVLIFVGGVKFLAICSFTRGKSRRRRAENFSDFELYLRVKSAKNRPTSLGKGANNGTTRKFWRLKTVR